MPSSANRATQRKQPATSRRATSPAISKQLRRVDLAEQPLDVFDGDRAARERRELLERGDGVAHPARRVPRDERERGVVDVEALAVADHAQPADDVVDADAVEVEALAARLDRLGHLVRMRGGQHEDDVGRRLLDGLEQRVERRRREHVDLVDDVDLVAALGRREEHAADDLLADVVDAGARRGVELVDVRVAPLGDLDALLAGAVGLGPWARARS